MKSTIGTVLLLCLVQLSLNCSASRRQTGIVRPQAPANLIVFPQDGSQTGGLFIMSGSEKKLMWDAVAEPDVVGYRVFFRRPGMGYNLYLQTTAVEYPLKDFQREQWYFVVQTVDRGGRVSDFSNEVFYNPLPQRQIMEWPDKRPLKLLPVYVKQDTLGNPLTPNVILEWRQMLNPKNPSSGYDSGWRVMSQATSDYTVSGDTLILNTPYLATFSATYTLTQDFRVKLSGPGGSTDYAYPPSMFKFIRAVTPGVPKPIKEILVF